MANVKQLFDLTGKVAVVTGGSRGLGLEIAEGLGEAGARVVITGRRPQFLAEGSAELAKLGIEHLTVVADVADPAGVREVMDRTIEWGGGIDILVNNAGISWGANAEEMPLDRWRAVIDTNLTGVFLMAQAAGQVMIKQGRGGRIINVSSILGLRGSYFQKSVGYHASKGGVNALTRQMAIEWAEHHILVNALCPGWFSTRLSKGLLEYAEEDINRETPLGRVGLPGELKAAAVFLASPGASYVTGSVLAVDGGVHIN